MRWLFFFVALLLTAPLAAQTISGGGSGITSLTGGVTATGPGAAAATVVTNANLTGDVTSVGNASTLANIPALSGVNLTTLNASNLSSGTVAAARGGAGTITGALKGSGAGVVTQAACADLSNGAASCSTDTTNASNIASGLLGSTLGGTGVNNAGTLTYTGSITLGTAAVKNTGTSGSTLPVLNVSNTWGAVQLFPAGSAAAAAVQLGGNAGTGIYALSSGNALALASNATIVGYLGTGAVTFGGPEVSFTTSNSALGGSNIYLDVLGAGHWRFGQGDAASPVAQIFDLGQSVSAGTSNTAAPNVTANLPIGTGTGAGSDLIIKCAPAGTTGTAKNILKTCFTVSNTGVPVRPGFTVSTLPASPPTGSMAYVTDAVACTFLATLTGGGSAWCPVGYNGSGWVGE